jgi:formylglycine-generating enzyme required for sulfatase activity/TolB-like protein
MINRITLLLFIGLAWGQIAVFDFENHGGLESSEVKILTARLQGEMVKAGGYKVVERKKIEKVFEEQKFQMSGCVEECLIEIGKLLGAKQIVIGDVGKFGSTYTINARLVDATTGEIIRASDFDTDGSIDGLLKTGMQIIATELSGQKAKKTKPTQVYETPIKQPTVSVPNIDMVFVEGGTFQMGSNSRREVERPIHTVTVSSFYMDKTEVTQAEYRKVMGENPSSFSGCDDCPVEMVTWHDANTYAKKVGKRLPTEAEWEYAARGGNKSKGYTYSGGNDLNAVGWFFKTGGDKTHPVAQKQPNELGLYDMSGNVWEWCSDWFGFYDLFPPKYDPQGPNSGSSRVLRSGPFVNNSRVAHRDAADPNYGWNDRGFRLVLSQD